MTDQFPLVVDSSSNAQPTSSENESNLDSSSVEDLNQEVTTVISTYKKGNMEMEMISYSYH